MIGGGFPKNLGYLFVGPSNDDDRIKFGVPFVGPYNDDYSIWGSILGSLCFGEVPAGAD